MERELDLYYRLLFVRRFEEQVSLLHRQNKILGGVYSGMGQEAVTVGTCHDLQPGDFVFPLHRDLGAFLMRGVDPGRLMAQLMGREQGLSRGKDSFLHGGDLEHGVFGPTSMLAASLPVACGVALKFKLRREPNVAVAYVGEGATSRGDFHEALNFAGIHGLPVLFVCENNRWAYSTPIELQMPVANVADRAPAYGMRGAIVPGNDLLLVLEETRRAVAQARAGGGPTLLECKTYRIHGHSEHDRAAYRAEEEVIEWRARDPILMWEAYLAQKGHDVQAVRREIAARADRVVGEAAAFAEASPLPEPASALEDLFVA